jgi:hypothetical protein
LLKFARAIGAGFAGGLACILLIGVLSGLTMSRSRAVGVARDALRSDEVAHPFSYVEEDYFTECALLVMQTARTGSVARNVIETWLPPEALAFGHPCETLRRYVAGTIRYSTPASGRSNSGMRWDVPYVSYWFGSRHLEAIVLRVVGFGQAKSLYRLLSYGSVLVLALGAWLSNRRSAMVLVPVFASLLFGFSMHLNGQILAHAPGFFAAFLLLAVLVWRRRFFERFERRLALFAFLGVVASYFDILDGVLLIVLSLAVVVDHFFYVRGQGWRVALGHGVAIFGCFAFSYVAVTVVHLGLLSLLHRHVWQTYSDGLSVRLGSVADSGKKVGPVDVALALWSKRGNLVPGGTEPSTWFLAGGLAGWILAATGLPLALRRRPDGRLLADLGVLLMATGGIVAWCLLFPNHTFVHRGFTVRYLTLPAAYGAVAAVLVALALRSPARELPAAPALAARRSSGARAALRGWSPGWGRSGRRPARPQRSLP